MPNLEAMMCDCERGHNGTGIVGRECDCQPADPITALVRLRAKVLHLANEVQGLADAASIRDVRVLAPTLRDRLVDAIMTTEMIKASRR